MAPTLERPELLIRKNSDFSHAGFCLSAPALPPCLSGMQKAFRERTGLSV